MELGGPVAPVCGPVLFRHDSRLLSLELWPILARNLHRVVLRQFVFVVGALEEAALSAARRNAGGRGKREKKKGVGRKSFTGRILFFSSFLQNCHNNPKAH